MQNKNLLKKYLEEQLSEEEFEKWMEILNQTEDLGEYDELLGQLWNESQKSSDLPSTTSQRLLANFQRSRQKEVPQQNQVFLSKAWYAAAAVAALLVTGITMWLFLEQDQQISYTTGNGETRTLTLPDNSTVTLNANSSISYQEHWQPEHSREVWLDGEAFFSVVHTQNNQRFRVNVTHDFTVEVLGTEFNVKDRHDKAQVVLNTGQVRLDIKETDQPQTLMMQPGELVEFSGTEKTWLKKQVNPESYSSWRHHKMILEETSLQEIAKVLEDNYGVSIIIEDTTLSSTRLSGAFPTDNLDMILTSLPTIVDMEVVKNKDTIFFKNK